MHFYMLGNVIFVKDKLNGEIKMGLIDTGIVAELSAADRRNFLDLFKAVVTNSGSSVGELMIQRSRYL